MINGSLSRSSSQSTSVDVRPVSSSSQQIQLEDNGSPIEITFTSSRSADYWDFLTTTQSNVDSVGSTARGDGFYDVTVALDQGQTYQVQLTKVGVGTRVTDENTAYITDTEGDGQTVSQGKTTEFTLEVRDRFNNPPDNASTTTVEAEVDGSGTLKSTSETPDADGEVTFVYQAPTGTTGTETIQFSYVGIDNDFDATTPQNASMTVDVTSSAGGSSSAYTVAWQNPEGDNDNSYLSDCSDSACTWDVGADDDDVLTLRAGNTPTIEGANLDFAVDDSTVGTINPEENTTVASGEATTDLTAKASGDVGVYAASGGSSNKITITVENIGGGNDPSAIQFSNFQGFTADAVNDDFTLEEVQVQDADNDDDLDRIEYVVTDSNRNEVATQTVNNIGPAQYQQSGSPAVTITGDLVQESETYTITATVYDADGNFDSESLSDTTDSYAINSVSPTSAATGNDIDVSFDISTTDDGAQVDVQSLKSDGSVRDSTGLTAGADTQPQTETIDGDNQANEARVILYDSSGVERDRMMVPYP